jgi:nicotinamidase-related amidase
MEGAPMQTSFLLSKTGTVLIVIDVQDKFKPAIPHFESLVDNITRLILTFQMFRMPVIVTEQYPKGLGPTVERLRKLFPLLEVVEKLELAATDNPRFESLVNPLKATTFVVCGVETHVCVSQTVIKLIEKGMQVHVVADAIGSRRPLDHNIALRKMELAGARIATTEMCLFELAEKAGTETFKNIQRMVKGKPSGMDRVLPKSAPGAPPAMSPTKTAGLPKGAGAGATTPIPQEMDGEKTRSLTETAEGEKTRAATETTVLADVPPERKQPTPPQASGDGSKAPAKAKEPAAGGGDPALKDLLQSIEKEVDGAVKNSDKSEKEIMNDMQEIDKLIGNIGNKDSTSKQ